MIQPTRMKRTPLRRVSKKLYPDCHGYDLDEARRFVQRYFGRVADWPTITIVKDPNVCRMMHARYTFCWNCGYPKPEAHHCCGGTKGRSDELCNIAMLCGTENFAANDGGCHPKANTRELPMGRILFLKWKHDREHCDWIRLTLLARRFLPDLIP